MGWKVPIDISSPLSLLSLLSCALGTVLNSAATRVKVTEKSYWFYSQVALVVKNPPPSAGDTGDTSSIPGSGRATGEGSGNPLQYSCLGNPMDRGAWRATVQRVPKSQMQLSTHTQTQTPIAFYQPCNWHQYHFLLKSTLWYQCTWQIENIFWTFFRHSFPKIRTEFPSSRWKYWNCFWFFPSVAIHSVTVSYFIQRFSQLFSSALSTPPALSLTYHSLLGLHVGSKPLTRPPVCLSSPWHRAQWEGQGGSSREGPSLDRKLRN